MKKVWKILKWTIGSILLLILIFLLLLQTEMFQTWITNRIADYVADELGTEVDVEGVNIDFFSGVILEGVYIEDLHGDTLLYAPNITAGSMQFLDKKKPVDLGEITIDSPRIFLKKYPEESDLNIQFIVDYFKVEKDTTNKKAPRLIVGEHMKIQNGYLIYRDLNKPAGADSGLIDWNDLVVTGVNLDARKLQVNGDTIVASLEFLSGKDKSGFFLESFSGDLQYDPELIVIENYDLETPNSDLHGRMAYKYADINDFNDFVNKVRMNHNVQHSTLELSDLGYFTPDMQGIDRTVNISGKVTGKVRNLKGKNLEIQIDKQTRFVGDLSMDGLPNIDQTFITLDINELTSNKDELDQLPLFPFDSGRLLKTPDNFETLGQLSFQGNFIGFINDFTAYGVFQSDIGSIETDIKLYEDQDEYFYTGELDMLGFNVGEFYDNSDLGILTSNLSVSGKGLRQSDFETEIAGTIQRLEFNDYLYKNMIVKGTFKDNFFNGKTSIKDENLFMSFDGKIDFTRQVPAFSFTADVENIDLVSLNFLENVEYSSMSAQIEADFTGIDYRDLYGSISLKDVTYCISNDECRLEQIYVNAQPLGKGKSINFNSSIATGTLVGEYDINHVHESLMGIMAQWVPAFEPPPNTSQGRQNFSLEFTVHDYDLITRFITPELYVSPNARISMHINEYDSTFDCNMNADSIRFREYGLDAAILDARRQDSAIYFTMISDELFLTPAYTFGDFSLDGRTENDTIYLSSAWQSPLQQHEGDINGQFTIRGNQNFDFIFNYSSVGLAGQQWNFDPKGAIIIDERTIQINNMHLLSGDQFLKVNGVLSEDPKPRLNVDFQEFDLGSLNPLLADQGVTIAGMVNGHASMQDVYRTMLFTSDLSIDDFRLNDEQIGDVLIVSNWEPNRNRLSLHGDIDLTDYSPLSFSGFYKPSDPKSPLDIDVFINSFGLEFINSFFTEGLSDVQGSVNGEFHVGGKPTAPLLNGEVEFEGVQFTIDYLNTTYKLYDAAGIRPDMFTLDGVRIEDQEGNGGLVTGNIMHENFSDWNYNAAVFLDEEYFLCMNTTEDDNSLYYGKAYGKGEIYISGYSDNLELEINMSSGPGTIINLPLGGSDEVTFEDFVTFVSDEDKVEERLDLSGIDLNFVLDVTPDARFQIIFDEAVGDVMKGRGEGVLFMDINTNGNFEMAGEMRVIEGDYLFTLKNLINKEFEMVPGGSIIWTGDPLAAELNLSTMYKLSSPLNDILADNSGAYNQRVPVDLVMDLSGPMLNPQIKFSIDLPESDQITKSRVAAAMSSEQELNRQAFALLIMRRFVAPPSVGGANPGGGILAENSLEMLSAQLGLWLQGITDKFDIGFDYRPGDEISNEEISLALSTQVFNDRLTVSGNFGVSQGNEANQNPSSIIGDLKLEYNITEDGKIRLVVFNESNQFEVASTDQSPYTQGVGILYREEFDNMQEFYCGFRNLLLSEEKRVNCDE